MNDENNQNTHDELGSGLSQASPDGGEIYSSHIGSLTQGPKDHPKTLPTTEELLAERGKTHGDYTDHARITQALKILARAEPGWDKLNFVQRESIEMIFHKIGRALSGNPNYADHWDDIAGYARLVSQRL